MSGELFASDKRSSQEQRKGDRRKSLRRSRGRTKEQGLKEHEREFSALLDLGQIIGIDLKIEEMLVQSSHRDKKYSHCVHDGVKNENRGDSRQARLY